MGKDKKLKIVKAIFYCIKKAPKIFPLLPDYFRIRHHSMFDTEHYLAAWEEAAKSPLPPALHYLYKGAKHKVNPNAKFDFVKYARNYADVEQSGTPPLLHYIRYGIKEGRTVPTVISQERPSVHAPSWEEWKRLALQLKNSSQNNSIPSVTIVIPVFRGIDETLNCIFSVITSRIEAHTPYRIVAINDHSPEQDLVFSLECLADIGLIELYTNEKNLGFVASVNRGMSIYPESDIIILNSDTEVYNDWVERLQKNIYSAYNIGTATPFSNNATICSYPLFCQDYPFSFGIDFPEVDTIARTVNGGQHVDIPTGVGFCMYIKRDCLNEIGIFDYQRFGQGYGEENDFCQRAWKQGWRSILCTDTFVRHLGSVSFGNQRSEKVKNATKILLGLHPNYEKDVQRFCKEDPARIYREKIDLAIAKSNSTNTKTILHILHHWGGGTEQHVTDLCHSLTRQGVTCIIGYPSKDRQKISLSIPSLLWDCNIREFDLTDEPVATAALIQEIGINHIHIHHTIGFEFLFPEKIVKIAHAASIPYDFTAHDYYSVCPRINMIDTSSIYCDSSNTDTCTKCLNSLGPLDIPVDSIEQWQGMYRDFLYSARKVFVPDQDVALRLHKYYPDTTFTVRKHIERLLPNTLHPTKRDEEQPLRVAIIGRLTQPKGRRVIEQCAAEAAKHKLPLRFVLIGTPYSSRLKKTPSIEVFGEYTLDQLECKLERAKCHMAFFPAVWPETYSYTLSQAIATGLFPVSFSLGAIGRRIQELGWGETIELAYWNNPTAINNFLLSCKITPLPKGARNQLGGIYPDMLQDYYAL